jgi:exodeoxyribonuclease VII small subunit
MTAKGKALEKLNFEDAMERLEKTVDQLESGELSLEESIKAFERGIELSKLCRKKLEKAEERVKKLLEKSDGSFDLELFEHNGEDSDE